MTCLTEVFTVHLFSSKDAPEHFFYNRTHTHTHTHTHARALWRVSLVSHLRTQPFVHKNQTCTHTHARTHARTYTFIHTYTCLPFYTHCDQIMLSRGSTRTHARTHARTRTHVCTHTKRDRERILARIKLQTSQVCKTALPKKQERKSQENWLIRSQN